MIYADAIEEKARELCKADGHDPDAVDWMGDPSIPYGTVQCYEWEKYADDARAFIKTAIEVMG